MLNSSGRRHLSWLTRSSKLQEFRDAKAAVEARIAEETRLAEMQEEDREREMARVQENADLDRRRVQLQQFLDYPGVEAIDPLSGNITKVPMIERKHPHRPAGHGVRSARADQSGAGACPAPRSSSVHPRLKSSLT